MWSLLLIHYNVPIILQSIYFYTWKKNESVIFYLNLAPNADTSIRNAPIKVSHTYTLITLLKIFEFRSSDFQRQIAKKKVSNSESCLRNSVWQSKIWTGTKFRLYVQNFAKLSELAILEFGLKISWVKCVKSLVSTRSWVPTQHFHSRANSRYDYTLKRFFNFF